MPATGTGLLFRFARTAVSAARRSRRRNKDDEEKDERRQSSRTGSSRASAASAAKSADVFLDYYKSIEKYERGRTPPRRRSGNLPLRTLEDFELEYLTTINVAPFDDDSPDPHKWGYVKQLSTGFISDKQLRDIFQARNAAARAYAKRMYEEQKPRLVQAFGIVPRQFTKGAYVSVARVGPTTPPIRMIVAEAVEKVAQRAFPGLTSSQLAAKVNEWHRVFERELWQNYQTFVFVPLRNKMPIVSGDLRRGLRPHRSLGDRDLGSFSVRASVDYAEHVRFRNPVVGRNTFDAAHDTLLNLNRGRIIASAIATASSVTGIRIPVR